MFYCWYVFNLLGLEVVLYIFQCFMQNLKYANDFCNMKGISNILRYQFLFLQIWSMGAFITVISVCATSNLSYYISLLQSYCNEGDTFLDTLSLETRLGSTIMLQKPNATIWNGNVKHCQSKRSLKLKRQLEKWCWHIFGLHKSQFWNNAKRWGHNSEVSVIVKFFRIVETNIWTKDQGLL